MNIELPHRKAVATIIGMVIAFGIIFSLLVPLMLYYQNATALYNQSVSERRSLESEKLLERLMVTISLSPANSIKVQTVNIGGVPVAVSHILILDKSQADAAVRDVIREPYGTTALKSFESRIVDTGVLHTTGRYVKLITKRGNIFSAELGIPSGASPPEAIVIISSRVQLSLNGPAGPWAPLFTTWENLKKAMKDGNAYVRVDLRNVGSATITLTTASQVLFILAQIETPQNAMIVGKLTSDLTIEPEQAVSATFKILRPDPEIIRTIDLISESAYPLTAAGFLTLVTSPAAPNFVSMTVPVDALLLAARR